MGLSRGVKKLVQAKVPDLSRCQDISDFLTKSTMSESEAEDDEASHVKLSQKLSSRGNHANATSAVRLFELGPRITFQVSKLNRSLYFNKFIFITAICIHVLMSTACILVNQSRKWSLGR